MIRDDARLKARTCSAGQLSTRLHPASRSGTTTMRVGIQNLGRLGHEPDAAEGDDVAVEFLRLARQFQAVADGVGQFLDFGFLIMMRQDDRPALRASGRGFLR